MFEDERRADAMAYANTENEAEGPFRWCGFFSYWASLSQVFAEKYEIIYMYFAEKTLLKEILKFYFTF